jgi:hypothetical protein
MKNELTYILCTAFATETHKRKSRNIEGVFNKAEIHPVVELSLLHSSVPPPFFTRGTLLICQRHMATHHKMSPGDKGVQNYTWQ